MSILEAPDAPFRLNRPIEHIEELPDGTLLLPVVVTSETPDDQGEIIDYDGFKAAAPELMKWAVVSQMHDDGRADTGTIISLNLDDENRRAEAVVHVVDPVAIRKVLARVYKMVSLGGTKLQTRIETHGGRTLRRVVKLRASELSLVPLGSNPDAMIRKQFVLAKAGASMADDDGRTPEQVAYDAAVALLKAAADPDVGGGRVRSNIPKSDFVFPEDAPDGGFPITSAGDVQDAVSSWGRYRGSHSFEEFKSRVKSIARRKGYPLPKAWQKEESKMAKAARRTAAAAEEPTVTEEPIAKAAEPPADGKDGDAAGDGKAKGAFPGAKPPFKKKVRKARLRKMAAVRFAKGKNKTIKHLAEALEAVTCALSEEADEGESATVKALTDIANGIHEQMMVEAAEVHPDDDDDDDMEPMVADGDDDGDDDAIAYAKARRRDANAAPKLRKQLRKSRRTVRTLRKSRRSLRKQRRTLRKASLFTSVLTKAGARHSAADLAKIDAIHEQTVSLGTTSHRLADAVAGDAAPTDVAPDTIAKASAPAPTFAEQMRDALAGLVPADKLDAMERRLAAMDERSTAQSETLAKIAAQPSSAGPLTAVLRGAPATDEPSERGEVLAKAAALIDDPRLRSDVSSAAALEMIQARRASQ